ncbi:MAG: hypothetical protein K2R98_28750 [Gemmataceae bacterium]|nr:hypothetical protein [Gemmataceae bacterium]
MASGESSIHEENKPQGAETPFDGMAASRMTFWALALLGPTVTFIGTITPSYYLTDFWHHLAIGREIVQSSAVVHEDRFTFTVGGRPLRDADWLSQIILYAVYETGGLALVRTVNSLVLAIAIGVLVFRCQRASGSLLLATGVGLFTYFSLRELFIVRPQTFSFLLFAVLLASLELSENRRGWLLAGPVIQAVWVNMHGAFPLGFVAIGLFALGALRDAVCAGRWARFRDLALCLAAALLATSINPYGFAIYHFVSTTTTAAASRGLREWRQPWQVFDILEWEPLSRIVEPNAGKLWVVSILLVTCAMTLTRRRPTFRDWCLVLVFLAPTFRSVRMLGWWYLVSMPIMTAQLGPYLALLRWRASPSRPSPIMGGLCLGLIGLAVVISLPGVRNRLSSEPSPVESTTEVELGKAAEFLRERPRDGGRIFCQFEWGGFFNWALQPAGYRVFMDIRMDIIPEDVWNEYVSLFHGRADWQTILDKYHVTVLVLNSGQPELRELIAQVEQSKRWVKVFRDGDVLIFLRAAEGNPALSSTARSDPTAATRHSKRKPASGDSLLARALRRSPVTPFTITALHSAERSVQRL